jgi:thiol-disulfide isomerase/thioredoxin
MRHVALLALLLTSTCLATNAHALEIGDQAPALTGVTWVKGDAAEPKGAITVVEFWATWCGPCRKSIPHLTELQKKHGDKVHIIGLSDETPDKVKPFVAEMGAQMDYRVGLANKQTHAAYMEGVDGIPHAFLIDAGGTVLWQGHPGQLAGPLDQAVAGKFDATKVKTVAKAEKELQALLQGRQPDVVAALTKCDEILAIDPLNEQTLTIRVAIGKFQKNPAVVRDTIMRLPLDKIGADQANALAWQRATDEDLAYRNLDLALVLIDRALAIDPTAASFLDTKARILYSIGAIEDAIQTQEQAMKLGKDPAEMGATLAFYRSLLELRAKRAGTTAPKAVPAPAAIP